MTGKDNIYLTISELSEGGYKDKGSRFLAFAYPVKNESDIKSILDQVRKKYFDARHHCYAYRIGTESQVIRSNDDGEPSGTAGKPILGQIQSKELTNVLVVVVRYFGGTLLGTGGLIRAYHAAAADALSNASVVTISVMDHYLVEFPYLQMNSVMKLVKDFGLETYDPDFEMNCRLKVRIRKEIADDVLLQFSKLNELNIKLLFTE